jgi:broad specificity phosphatase PhoE
MKNIYFVRHGLSEANERGVVSGSENDTELTDSGREQAKKAGLELKSKEIELIVCSPMKRTIETAHIIANALEYNPDNVVLNDLFTERSYGVYSGKPNEEYRKDLLADKEHISVETTNSIYNRVKKGLQWLAKRPEKNIVLVGHGGTGRALKIINQKMHHSHMYKMDGFGNTEIYDFVLE